MTADKPRKAPDPVAETLDADVPLPMAEEGDGPHLRIFDPTRGARRLDLGEGEFVIGRALEADVLLADPYVSRRHAVLVRQGGECWIEDAGTKGGTLVNNERITKQALKDGDTIQIQDFVLQYRDGSGESDADEEEPTPAQKVFRAQYNYLPDSMSVRYRHVLVPPQKVFAPGDTVVVGEGGVLIPAKEIRCDEGWILEIEILWPDSQRRRFFGEFMGKLSRNLMCVKLHTRQEEKNFAWFETAKRDSWHEAKVEKRQGGSRS